MPSIHRTLALGAIAGASLASAQLGGVSQHQKYIARGRATNGGCPHVEAGFPVELVVAQAKNVSTHSWEYGTAAEALLELCMSCSSFL